MMLDCQLLFPFLLPTYSPYSYLSLRWVSTMLSFGDVVWRPPVRVVTAIATCSQMADWTRVRDWSL